MNRLRCSLIISVYKNIRFLQAVLDGLNYQTEQRFEVIISEDGESEEMRTFLAHYSCSWPLYHLTQPDEGWQKNRALNRAVVSAHTDHLVFIDGDCMLHPRFIEMHVRYFDPQKILAGKRVMLSERLSERLLDNPKEVMHMQHRMMSALVCHQGTERAEEGVFIDPDGPLGCIPRMRKLEYLTGCNMSFSRQAITAINGFDEDYTLPAYGEDTDLVWRFRMAGFTFVSLRNLAVEYHLWHKKGWNSQEENQRMGAEKQARGEYQCKNGLKKL